MLQPDDKITIPKEEPSLSRVNSAQWMIAAFLFTALAIGALFYKLVIGVGLATHLSCLLGFPSFWLSFSFSRLLQNLQPEASFEA
jgi:hypothetical protein